MRNGVWGDEPQEDGSDVVCVRAADFDRRRLRVKVDGFPMRHVEGRTLKSQRLKPGDIVLEKSGGGERQPVGAAVLFDLDVVAVCSNFCARLQPAKSVESRFLSYVLAAAYYLGKSERCIKQTTGIQNLDTDQFFATPWSYPVQDEQRRIADFLDAETARIDALADVQQRVLDSLSERRAGAVHAGVTGASSAAQRPTALAWATTLPFDWREGKLSLVARMGSGHTPSRSREDWWSGCTIPWITTGEVSQIRDDRAEEIVETREKISEVGLANSSAELCAKGTVVLCRTASAGYSAVMGTAMATSQDFVSWQCGPKLDPFYLLWCLRAMRSDLLGRLAMGSTHKTIYVPDLQMLRIPLPPVCDQREIVENIRGSNHRIDAAVDVVRRQIELIGERRQALITAAVTGQFDVTTGRGADLS